MQYTSHVKSGHLKNLIQQPLSCEQKLRALEQLLGLPPGSASNDEGGEGGQPPMVVEGEGNLNEQQAALVARTKSFERITADLSAQERRLAYALLQRIETSDNIGWDFETDEIILSNQRLLHSSIKTIIEKIVVVASPLLPIGFIRFIDALIKIKIPLQYIQNADALNIRLGLLTISRERQGLTDPQIEPAEEEPMVEELASAPPDDLQILNVSNRTGETVEIPAAEEIQATARAPPEDLQTLNVSNRARGRAPPADLQTLNVSNRASAPPEDLQTLNVSNRARARARAPPEDLQTLNVSNRARSRSRSREQDRGKGKLGIGQKAKGKGKATAKKPAEGVRRSKRLALRSDLTENWTPISRS